MPALFADMPAYPFIAMQSGIVVVAVFLALAFASGGLWLVRRLQGRPFRWFRVVCLVCVLVPVWSGALYAAVMAALAADAMSWLVAAFAFTAALVLTALLFPPKPRSE